MEHYSVTAPNQEYTDEFLALIRERDLVIYNRGGLDAIRIIPRKGMNPLFELLGEDDGRLFSYEHPVRFDSYWTESLIKVLQDALAYWETIKDRYQ